MLYTVHRGSDPYIYSPYPENITKDPCPRIFSVQEANRKKVGLLIIRLSTNKIPYEKRNLSENTMKSFLHTQNNQQHKWSYFLSQNY